jgi:hypothetical protein
VYNAFLTHLDAIPSGSDAVAGFIHGSQPIAAALDGYIRGLETATDWRSFTFDAYAAGSDARSGYIRGYILGTSARPGYVRGVASGSAGRLGYVRGAGTASTTSLGGYISGISAVVSTNVIQSDTLDLGGSFQRSDWYYDWVTETYNDATYTVLARSADTLGELYSASWTAASRDTAVPPALIKRYHQLSFQVVAREPRTFYLHQVTIRSITKAGRLYGYVVDNSGVPIVGARIDASGYGITSTDAAGYYNFASISAGTYSVTYSKRVGGVLTTVTISVTVVGGVETRRDVTLDTIIKADK